MNEPVDKSRKTFDLKILNEQSPTDLKLLRELLPMAFTAFLIGDIYALFILIYSFVNTCDVPLNWWLLGAVVLSFPGTFMTGVVKEKFGFSWALTVELSFCIISFLWFVIGTIMINISTTCQETAAVMWWTVFISCTLFWFTAVGMIFAMVSLAVTSIVAAGSRRRNSSK